MKTTTEKPVITSALTDVRQTPLGQLSAPEILDRLRPSNNGNAATAAFNASL